jgi:glycosyltransferase involved in cell wall biosynthesis
MSEGNPRVSIGMPVYNGERYLAETVDSLLAQTFKDFELIISDNGSTDRTEEICRSYAARDRRIRYHRSETNRGAAWNHNRVFQLSSGEYFKWASYDDPCAPEFLEKCVALLDREPSVVLCSTKLIEIDDDDKSLKTKSSQVCSLVESHARFRVVINWGHTCEEIYGLMRTDALRTTGLIGSYTSSDHTLLAEMALRGRFYEVPEVLFFHRWHTASTYRLWPDRSERWVWFDPSVRGRILFPWWRHFFEYLKAMFRSPVPWRQRWRCYVHLVGWLKDSRSFLWEDVHGGVRALIVRRAPWVKTAYHGLRALR